VDGDDHILIFVINKVENNRNNNKITTQIHQIHYIKTNSRAYAVHIMIYPCYFFGNRSIILRQRKMIFYEMGKGKPWTLSPGMIGPSI
jgi:hypothetical protein